MKNFIFTINTVAPVFLIVSVGYFGKRKGIINTSFTHICSRLLFSLTMPALVFEKISTTNYANVFNSGLIIFIYLGMLISLAIAWIVSVYVCHSGKDQGAFVQGSFRPNFAIIGFALIDNAYGIEALANAAIVLAFTTPLYNLLSIIVLTVPMHKETGINTRKMVWDIITNPLALAAVIALPFSYFQVTLPAMLQKTIAYLAALTLPLALLAIGASLNFASIRKDFKPAILASLLKIMVTPLLFLYPAYRLGFREVELGIIFFFFGGPTAIASYVMADAMGSNGELSGNIILISTIGSVFTVSIGIFVLKSFGLL